MIKVWERGEGGTGGCKHVMSAWIGMRDWSNQAFQNVATRQMKMLWGSKMLNRVFLLSSICELYDLWLCASVLKIYDLNFHLSI